MPMLVGDATLGTGMAGVIYTQMQTVTGFQTSAAGKAFANALAQAIVTYIQTNATLAVVGVTVGGGVATGTIT